MILNFDATTRRPQTFTKQKPSVSHKLTEHINIIAGLSRPLDRPHKQSRMGEQQSFCKKNFQLGKTWPRSTNFYISTPKLSEKYVCSPIFYIWTPKLLKKYVHSPWFPKMTTNFVTIHWNPPLSTNFYLWAFKPSEKNLQTVTFSRKKIPQTSIQSTHRL
jgi:hypothetical protein